jgi:phosphoribosylanthranilate isomerase
MTARTRVKVCCIASAEEARMAIDAGADALGFVAAVRSGSGDQGDRLIRRIVDDVPPPVSTFLLTPFREAGAIAAHVGACATSTVQIVDHIDPGLHRELAGRLPALRRVQVIHVQDAGALDLLPAYEPHVHAFLLDSGKPGGTMRELGGTGKTHDWDISAEFVRRSRRPVFLAGGLTPDNAAEAIRRVRPFGLDLCSGLRTEGHLDQSKLSAFMAAVRAAA